MNRFATVSLFLVFGFVQQPAQSADETYPTRPIRLVDAFPAGGPSDLVARSLNRNLTEALGQPVIVDNRGGAAGVLGCDIVAKSAPDGYTLLLGPSGALTIQPSISAKLPYNVQRDFATVTQLTRGPQVIVVNPSLPAKTVQELIALAKSKPGAIGFASGGVGAGNHIAAEMFKAAARIDMVHVPYKGTGPALLAVISGESQMMVSALVPTVPHLRSGKLRALGVTSKARSSVVPDVPTVAESGLPNFETTSWHGILVPAKTPRAVVNRLHAEFVRVLALPEVSERLRTQGLDVGASTPEEFSAYIAAETAKYAQILKQIGFKPE